MNRLDDMAPTYSMNDAPNSRRCNVKLLGNILLRHAVGVELPDKTHLVFVEFRLMMKHSEKVAALVNFVLCVIGVCSFKEVSRINTRLVVTLVANVHAVGDRAIVKFVRYTMGQIELAFVGYSSISKLLNIALPFPARVRFAGRAEFPEGLVERVRTAGIMTGSKTLRLTFCVALCIARDLGNWCQFTTSTLAIAVRDFIKWKLGLGKFWGMLLHVNSPFVTLTKAGTLARRLPLFIGSYLFNFNTFGLELQRMSAPTF